MAGFTHFLHTTHPPLDLVALIQTSRRCREVQTQKLSIGVKKSSWLPPVTSSGRGIIAELRLFLLDILLGLSVTRGLLSLGCMLLWLLISSTSPLLSTGPM